MRLGMGLGLVLVVGMYMCMGLIACVLTLCALRFECLGIFKHNDVGGAFRLRDLYV